MIGFYSENAEYGCFSNWYHAPFTYAGKEFPTSEHFMMYHKVMIFDQKGLGKMILECETPKQAKAIGATKFESFDGETWNRICRTVVKRGVSAKFRQHPELREILLGTGHELLAECSPTDRKWGTGTDTEHSDPLLWTGQNLLGRILMEVRDELRQEERMGGAFFTDWCSSETTCPEWDMKVGDVKRIPQFYDSVAAYSRTIGDAGLRHILYSYTFSQAEKIISGGVLRALPEEGFPEMKQEIHEISKRLG